MQNCFFTPSTSRKNHLSRLFGSLTFSVSGPKLSHAKIAMDGVWMGWGWIAINLNDTLILQGGENLFFSKLNPDDNYKKWIPGDVYFQAQTLVTIFRLKPWWQFSGLNPGEKGPLPPPARFLNGQAHFLWQILKNISCIDGASLQSSNCYWTIIE